MLSQNEAAIGAAYESVGGNGRTERMVCELCASLDRARAGEGSPAHPNGSQEVSGSVCEICGKPASAPGVLTKLTQLARFGLAGPPLLELSRRRP